MVRHAAAAACAVVRYGNSSGAVESLTGQLRARMSEAVACGASTGGVQHSMQQRRDRALSLLIKQARDGTTPGKVCGDHETNARADERDTACNNENEAGGTVGSAGETRTKQAGGKKKAHLTPHPFEYSVVAERSFAEGELLTLFAGTYYSLSALSSGLRCGAEENLFPGAIDVNSAGLAFLKRNRHLLLLDGERIVDGSPTGLSRDTFLRRLSEDTALVPPIDSLAPVGSLFSTPRAAWLAIEHVVASGCPPPPDSRAAREINLLAQFPVHAQAVAELSLGAFVACTSAAGQRGHAASHPPQADCHAVSVATSSAASANACWSLLPALPEAELQAMVPAVSPSRSVFAALLRKRNFTGEVAALYAARPIALGEEILVTFDPHPEGKD
eukprot:TRINITY_DN12826_c0_g1_i1.p1 TRINITY_DN12826_c0_g1~~TRINITY_DN12826_c0_g1_i1.p1  ORF type:complete len:388 (+),score=80.50 TRINITY_DN12826_c0_g1_i1:399-1562(+)